MLTNFYELESTHSRCLCIQTKGFMYLYEDMCSMWVNGWMLIIMRDGMFFTPFESLPRPVQIVQHLLPIEWYCISVNTDTYNLAFRGPLMDLLKAWPFVLAFYILKLFVLFALAMILLNDTNLRNFSSFFFVPQPLSLMCRGFDTRSTLVSHHLYVHIHY